MNDTSSPLGRRALAAATSQAIRLLARFITGLHSSGHAPVPRLTVYYGNHTSHGDFILIWAALPAAERRRTRPVAGQDYWDTSAMRRFIGHDVFRALMIRRGGHVEGVPSPIGQMTEALDAGSSLILFPEGTRNLGEAALLPFKSGIYHLAHQRPDVDLVPVWIDNIWRVMPKGYPLPVPLACQVRFGDALHVQPDEDKSAFLERARNALLALRPEDDLRPANLPPEETEAPQGAHP